MRLFEATSVDHVVVVDRSRWSNFIYDSADRYPIMMSSVALLKCAGPDATKERVIQLYRVLKLRQKKGMEQVIPILSRVLQ